MGINGVYAVEEDWERWRGGVWGAEDGISTTRNSVIVKEYCT